MEDILRNRVKLNGKPGNNTTLIKKGDYLEYLHFRKDEEELDIDLPVLYEDEWMIAVSKPDFLPVTPSTNFYYNSMAIWVKETFGNREISPVHRLDIETSGVLLFGKTKEARSQIQRLFRELEVKKVYQAVVFNSPGVNSISGSLVPSKNSKIFTKQDLVASKEADSLTLIEKQEPWGKYFRLWVKPVTGKTNQIRVHLAAIGCPIIGDKKYYPDEKVFLDWFEHRDISRILNRLKLSRQALHCQSISFTNPFSQQKLNIIDHTSDWEQKIEQLL